jgi:hypothetical protein
MECLPKNKTSTQMHMIGVASSELRWLKTLVWLLRHPDPSVPELARQALLYLTGAAEQRDIVPISGDEPHKVSPNLVS